MTVMATEQPIPEDEGKPSELEVNYTYDDGVLELETSYGAASVKLSVDFNTTSFGPDANALLQMLPTILATTHQHITQEDPHA
jgi:hypothetical protein